MSTTITDIAKRVGVSISTVSRVINNSVNVSDETRQKILEVMEELNYKPYYSLVMKSTKVIGVLVPDINNMYYPQVLKAMEKEFINNRYNIFLCNTSNSIEEEKVYLETLKIKNVDGLIFFSSRPKNSNSYIKNISKKIPVLLINEYILGSNTYSILTDQVEGTFQAVNYLIELGHKKIAFINVHYDYPTYEDKLMGYKNALEENDIEYRDEYVVFDSGYEEGGYRGTKKLFDLKKNKPTAILTASDQMAIGVYRAVYEQGYSIPKDFSVIGYGNIPVSANLYPPLTTVNHYPKKIGKLAANTIMKAIARKEIEHRKIIMHPQLLIRDSCSDTR